jgi:hypothetical protein
MAEEGSAPLLQRDGNAFVDSFSAPATHWRGYRPNIGELFVVDNRFGDLHLQSKLPLLMPAVGKVRQLGAGGERRFPPSEQTVRRGSPLGAFSERVEVRLSVPRTVSIY